ncbi:hypothetical protein [Niastella sp. OAS944]|nr:hypothetical protein [Chitinophagaceae bacterium OAS944]
MAFKQWATGNGQFAKKTLAVALELQQYKKDNRSGIINKLHWLLHNAN